MIVGEHYLPPARAVARIDSQHLLPCLGVHERGGRRPISLLLLWLGEEPSERRALPGRRA